MARRFSLEILTPDKQFFVGEAEELIMPALDGAYGVEAGHEPIVTALVPGELRFQSQGEWQTAVVSQGFAEVMPDYAILLVASAEHPGEIDLNRADAARERAEERLRQQQSVREHYNSQAALARAMARLKSGRK